MLSKTRVKFKNRSRIIDELSSSTLTSLKLSVVSSTRLEVSAIGKVEEESM